MLFPVWRRTLTIWKEYSPVPWMEVLSSNYNGLCWILFVSVNFMWYNICLAYADSYPRCKSREDRKTINDERVIALHIISLVPLRPRLSLVTLRLFIASICASRLLFSLPLLLLHWNWFMLVASSALHYAQFMLHSYHHVLHMSCLYVENSKSLFFLCLQIFDSGILLQGKKRLLLYFLLGIWDEEYLPVICFRSFGTCTCY